MTAVFVLLALLLPPDLSRTPQPAEAAAHASSALRYRGIERLFAEFDAAYVEPNG
jgi:hypothetical protein